jgi:hypothetical protein
MTHDDLMEEISSRTGLVFCGDDCDCGDCSELWFTQPGEVRDDLPAWVNGSTTEDLAEWLGIHQ